MGYTWVRLSALESIANGQVLFSCVKLKSGLVFCVQRSLVPACEVRRHVRRVLVALRCLCIGHLMSYKLVDFSAFGASLLPNLSSFLFFLSCRQAARIIHNASVEEAKDQRRVERSDAGEGTRKRYSIQKRQG
jgi:hypothetical protein